jgi:archaellum component FlaC
MEDKVQETIAVHSAEIEHMKKDIDHIISKVDKMDTQIDRIEKALSELSGGRKVALWIFSGLGVIAGIVATMLFK